MGGSGCGGTTGSVSGFPRLNSGQWFTAFLGKAVDRTGNALNRWDSRWIHHRIADTHKFIRQVGDKSGCLASS